MSMNKLFKFKTDKTVVFVGKNLVVKIPKRFENYKLITIEDTVKSIGVFDMEADGKKAGMMLPAVIELCPSNIDIVTEDGADYVMCTFNHGDTFIANTNIVRNPHLAYVLFTEFVEKGKMPSFLSYQDYAFVLDIAQDISGLRIPADHVTFEVIYAFLARKYDDYTKMYRLTDMKKPPLFLRLSDTAHATTSVTAKLIGSYLGDSINAAIVNEAENESNVEELLRQ